MKRTLLGGGLVLVLMALLWWLLTPPERRVVRPSQTLRALKSRLKRKVPVPPRPPPAHAPMSEVPPEDRTLTHAIDLDEHWSASVRSIDAWFIQTLPESYWPHLDEVDWPKNPSVEALQGLIDDEVETTLRSTMPFFSSEPNPAFLKANEQLQDLLDLAEEEGLLSDTPIWERPPPDDADPWSLLHQAQLHRAAELHAYLHSDTENDLRPGQQEEGYGLPEASWLASRIADQDPEHPAADFARLMLLETSQWELSGKRSDPQLAVDDVVAAVTKTEDPMVKETALIGLLGVDAEGLEGADTGNLLAVLKKELHILPPAVQDAVSAQALEIAIRTHPEAIGTWLDQLEKADTDGEEAVIDAGEFQTVLDDLSGRGLREPNNWSSELHANAWACHRDHPMPAPAGLSVTATWSEGWVWEEPTTDYNNLQAKLPAAWWSCFKRASWVHKPPGKRLEFRVHHRPFLE